MIDDQPAGRPSRQRRALYVVDAHALHWYLHEPDLLSRAAEGALDRVATGYAEALIPAIVVAEIYYLTAKQRKPVTPLDLFAAIEGSPGFLFSPLGRRQLAVLDQLTAISEMHDRLIVADALVHQAVLITRDTEIQRSGLVPTLW